ncbi:MAG: hypothetical protein EPN65_16795 [Pandoraea sp.]|uniref:phage baseplate protein n=1 Tax=Pandoraea sp. TaxID=1883445 RepID=UPI0011FE1F76|nr:hypothetical protein [Pandoraea sp.]TAM15972.1 MAG: hypothetical protein EPN65_16795 [Pandoraea sp.]
MPMPIISVPTYPDVPQLPGVPAVLRNPQAQISVIQELVNGDVLGALNDALRPTWGVFDASGNPVAIADTVTTLEYRADSRVPTYTQEDGSFESYNKVEFPYEARVQLVCGRNASYRAAFLEAIKAAKESTNLYSVVTPDVTYANANIVAYDVRRETHRGATLLKVNLILEEIRVTAVATFSNTQNSASADPMSQGVIQLQPPAAGQAALFGPIAVTSGPGGVL